MVPVEDVSARVEQRRPWMNGHRGVGGGSWSWARSVLVAGLLAACGLFGSWAIGLRSQRSDLRVALAQSERARGDLRRQILNLEGAALYRDAHVITVTTAASTVELIVVEMVSPSDASTYGFGVEGEGLAPNGEYVLNGWDCSPGESQYRLAEGTADQHGRLHVVAPNLRHPAGPFMAKLLQRGVGYIAGLRVNEAGVARMEPTATAC